MIHDDPHGINSRSLRAFYLIGTAATAIGIGVVMLLNMATPLAYILDQFAAAGQGESLGWGRLVLNRFLGLLFLAVLSCLPLLVVMRQILNPISDYLKQVGSGRKPSACLLEKARRRLINLPFILVPINVGLWILLPGALFYAAYATGRVDSLSAWVFALRSTMVGVIAAAIVSFWIESQARRRLIPFFFPHGRLTEVQGAARISISRRIRVLYRIGSLVPIAVLLVTLITLQWQVDSAVISAKEYGHGILVFSLVLFIVFFFGLSVLNKLVSRSIVRPVNEMLYNVALIKEGNYDAQVQVVTNDEIGILGDATNEMIRNLREKEILRDAFGKYISPEIRDEILSGRIPLDGELKEVSVLFADLRDFTAMTESNDPKLVTKILNSYFNKMAEAIERQSGLVLQFLGDEIYAVFGAPIYRPDHAMRAFMAALSMKKRLAGLNDAFSNKGWPNLRHGIGIHTGIVVAANIGSPRRQSYLLVGDTVNLASRLQSLTRQIGAEIILSEDTYTHLSKEEIKEAGLRRLPPVAVKGKSRPVEILCID